MENWSQDIRVIIEPTISEKGYPLKGVSYLYYWLLFDFYSILQIVVWHPKYFGWDKVPKQSSPSAGAKWYSFSEVDLSADLYQLTLGFKMIINSY